MKNKFTKDFWIESVVFLMVLSKFLSCIVYLSFALLSSTTLLSNIFFLSFPGTKEERAVNSLKSMGPAIINGGITTFLALVLLGFSQSHVFITFFKASVIK